MNKKASSVLYYFMLGIILIVFGMAIAAPIGDTSSESMDSSFLNCSTTTDDENKAVCTQIDLFQPLYVGMMLGLAGLLIWRMAS